MSEAVPTPNRGDVWLVDFDPVEGHEQSGRRPGLVISIDRLNHSRAELAIVMPLTTKRKNVPTHVPLSPPEGGLPAESFVICEGVRSVSTRRFVRRYGRVSGEALGAVEANLRRLLGL